MRYILKKIINFTICLFFIFSTMTIFFTLPTYADDLSPQIWTTDEDGINKNDFKPESIVYINGEGFSTDTTVTIEVTRPDGEVDSGTITTNSNGEFVFEYDLDGIEGNYTVYTTDGANDASCIFTDLFPPITYRDNNHDNRISVFHPGDSIYCAIDAGCKSKFIWKNTTGKVVHEHPSSGWLTGGGPYYDSYELPLDAEIGTWTITRKYKCCSFFGCYESTTTRKFYVVSDSIIITKEDAHVNKLCESLFTDNNFENSEKLHTKYKDIYILFVGWRLDQKRSYLKFDLPSISPGKEITSATLHMYRSCGDPSAMVNVYDVGSDSWSESTVTWNNKPTSSELIDTQDVGLSGDDWYTWDIKNAVINEYSNGDKELNLEVRLDQNEVGKHQDFFSSEENDQSAYRGPFIQITMQDASQPVGGFIIPVDKTALAQVYDSGSLSTLLVTMISLIFILMVTAIFIYKAKN